MNIPKSWKILVTGITSIHGWPIFSKLMECLPESGVFGVRPPKMSIPKGDNITPLCISDRMGLKAIRDSFNPTHVIHCAGVCDLDVCEARPNWARSINVGGAEAVADIFGDSSKIIYMSSDLIFSGLETPDRGYAEEDEPTPVSVVGKTIAEAETRIMECKDHCIVRLGLPLGDSITGDKGPINWIESRFKKKLPVTLFYDEFRSCINCIDLAELTVSTLAAGLEGVFHMGGERPWSLYEIGEYVLSKGNYSHTLLNGMLRSQEKNGPPRIGDVSLNSEKILKKLNIKRSEQTGAFCLSR